MCGWFAVFCHFRGDWASMVRCGCLALSAMVEGGFIIDMGEGLAKLGRSLCQSPKLLHVAVFDILFYCTCDHIAVSRDH